MTRIAHASGIVIVALAVAACTREELPTVRGEPLPPEPPEFEDTVELLEAVEEGTYAEEAGLTAEIAAATRPKPPPPPPEERIEFVRGIRVPADQEPQLERLAERLRDDPTLRVDLVGCSDPSGPEDLNLRISQSRAQSVADRLRGMGVADVQIDGVVGRGESCDVPERLVRIVPKRAEAGSGRSDGA